MIPNVQGNTWFDIVSTTGIIASINPNGMNLGDLTISIGDLAAPPTNGANIFLPRTMDIQCTAYPSGVLPSAYSIKLYYYDSEFDAYKTAISNTTATLSDLGIAWRSGGSGCTIAGYVGTSNGLIDKAMVGETDYGTGGNGFYLAFDLDHFTLFAPTINAPAPLPVHLLSFTGKAVNKTNELYWATATEQNADRFMVESSTDGFDFKNIGNVTAKGNSNITSNYRFTDVKPSNQLTNQPINYYRLKMIDKDGSFEYSNVISLRHKVSEFEVQSVYPNPTTSNINVSFTSETSTPVSFSLYDAIGKQILSIVKTSEIGFNLQNISMDDLPNCVYHLTISTSDGSIQTHKIVKM
jgi:Secretion system C-terminal sorting domain